MACMRINFSKYTLRFNKLKALPVKIYNIFVDTLKSQIKSWQNLNIVLSEFFIQVLELRFGFQLSFIILRTLESRKNFKTDIQINRWALYIYEQNAFQKINKYLKVTKITDNISIFLLVTFILQLENRRDEVRKAQQLSNDGISSRNYPEDGLATQIVLC